MATFFQNICRFSQCNLEFANIYDLIQHIEETHIPADSEKRPETHAQVACAPLSAICRYFQKLPDQPARPILPPEPAPPAHSSLLSSQAATMANLKKRLPSIISQSSSSAMNNLMPAPSGSASSTPGTHTPTVFFHPPANVARARSTTVTPVGSVGDMDEDTVSVGRESLSSESSAAVEDGSGDSSVLYRLISPSSSTSGDDRRFVCPVPGCKKRYKNMNGIRYHAKIAHFGNDMQTNSKKFRCQCGKAYKTSHGLHNHMLQTHHRQAPVASSVPVMGIGNSGNTKSMSNMAGVSVSAANIPHFKRGVPLSLMTSAGSSGGPTKQAVNQTGNAPPALSPAYYPHHGSHQQGAVKSGNSGTTTLPSGVSVQVSNVGGGVPTTVQVAQQGALGGNIGPSPTHGLHMTAQRRVSGHMQNNHFGGRLSKAHNVSVAPNDNGSVGVQGVVATVSSSLSLNAYGTSMAGNGDQGK